MTDLPPSAPASAPPAADPADGGPARRGTYHHGDLRAALVEATRRLVEKKGADHFSVAEACREAGVSTAAPYRHFRDREEMLAEVALQGMERKRALMVEALAAHPPRSLARIAALGHVYVGFARREPGVFRLIFGREDSPEAECLKEEAPRHYGLLEDAVAAFLARPAIDEDVRRRAFLLWTFVHGLSFLYIDEKVSVSAFEPDLDSLLGEIARRVLLDGGGSSA